MSSLEDCFTTYKGTFPVIIHFKHLGGHFLNLLGRHFGSHLEYLKIFEDIRGTLLLLSSNIYFVLSPGLVDQTCIGNIPKLRKRKKRKKHASNQ